jgi:hypothetical protein
MVQRCSNGVAFLVLEPEPSVRTGIRVDIFEGDNPLSLIARLPLTWGRRWTDPLKGTGSGEFWLHASDETLAANPGLLAYGNIARFSLDEVYRFAIQIEHLDRVQVRAGGDVQRTIKVTGRGVLSKLEEATLYPAGGLAGDPLRSFTDADADDLLGLAFDEAQTRGALAGLSRDFTASADSNNAPYDVTLTLEERAGVSVLRIAERMAELAGDVYMTPSGVLRFVNQRGVDRSLQLVNAGPVILQPAHNLEELTRSEDGQVRNVLLIETPGGFLERTEGGSVTSYGRREAFLSLGNIQDSDAIDRAATSVFAQSADPSAEIGAQVLDLDGARPYVDWGVGDWVLAPNEDDELERYRVRAITVSETKDGDPVFVPELATITEELEARLERWLSAMAKGTVGGTAAGVAEPVEAPAEVVDAIDAGIGDHLALQPHFDELADLADTDMTGLTAGDLLKFDGADWVPFAGTEEGDMLYRDDTGAWVVVSGGKATGRVPTIQASGAVAWEAPAGGGGGTTGPGSGATLVGSSTVAGSGSLSIPIPAGLTAGDLVVVGIATTNSVPDVNGPEGDSSWTELWRVDTSSNEYSAAYFKLADAGDEAAAGSGNWSMGQSASQMSIVCAVFDSVDSLWHAAWDEGEAETPWFVAHPSGLAVYIWTDLNGTQYTLPAGAGAVLQEADSIRSGGNNTQVFIAYRDTFSEDNGFPQRINDSTDSTFTIAGVACFYLA